MRRLTIWDNDNAASSERERRRFASDDRALAKLDRLLPKARALIGQICREGRIVHYINLAPLKRGRTLEGATADLTAYLIRNRYVA